MSTQPHIKIDKGQIAPTVLLPGDPARAEIIASFFDSAKKVIFNREYLIYTGKYKNMPISVCSTGMGCPSAAIAVEELANIGAKTFIRIGTCGGLKKKIKAGDLIIPTAAIRAEGTTREYISLEFPAVADFDVTQALINAAKKDKARYFTGVNRTHDAFYEHTDNLLKWGDLYKDDRMKKWDIPIVSSEMECSAIYLVAMLRGLKAGAILSVNTPEPLDAKIKDENEIFQLKDNKKAAQSVEKEIKIALEAALELYKKGL